MSGHSNKPKTEAGQIWLVFCECQIHAVLINCFNNGFYLPGQEPCWGFSHARTWLKCLYDPKIEERLLVGLVPD